MLLTVSIATKTMGTKELFRDLTFTVEANEKIAIIGRNGVGKTTLFRMLSGQDTDFFGDITFQRGAMTITTAQEHHNLGDQTVLEYIIAHLPGYADMKQIIDTYPQTMGDDMAKITAYTNALEHFSSLGYYHIEDNIIQSLAAYQLSEDQARSPMSQLSGGQKRFVELVRVEHSHADIALIDEPTNHMDYVAKAAFIDWLKSVKHAVVVITHDRDVLQEADRIIEIKDLQAFSFKGNYISYLRINRDRTSSAVQAYEVTQRRIENLKADIVRFKRLKEKARDPDTIRRFKSLENRAETELGNLQTQEKPNFWIDRESVQGLNKKVSDHYERYKARNIRIHKSSGNEDARELLQVEDIKLSYGGAPLFAPVSFRLPSGGRLQLVGRNGAGKTTLIRAITEAANGKRAATWRAGSIFTDRHVRLSVYQQETGPELLPLTLQSAIEHIYLEHNLSITTEKIMQLMSDYLFHPHQDGNLLVSALSGGQKARLQVIAMLATNPNLLILDEPTNHLDLPSVEELENALSSYHGAVLYVSHDSYFARNIGGEKIMLAPLT